MFSIVHTFSLFLSLFRHQYLFQIESHDFWFIYSSSKWNNALIKRTICKIHMKQKNNWGKFEISCRWTLKITDINLHRKCPWKMANGMFDVKRCFWNGFFSLFSILCANTVHIPSSHICIMKYVKLIEAPCENMHTVTETDGMKDESLLSG